MTDQTVVDPAQLRRIEGTHRGFLYQHLIAAGCILSAQRLGWDAVVVEADEDVEVVAPGRRAYLQIKHYGRPLQPADVRPSLNLFKNIRQRHDSGERHGSAAFYIISSSEPGPELSAQITGTGWPADVKFLSPARSDVGFRLDIRADVVSQWQSVVALAGRVPLSRATATTLAWKLTAIVQALATGAFGNGQHSVITSGLPELFEQVAALIDRLPEPPVRYLPQIAEPALVSSERIRVVAGPGGSGKTSWAASAAIHSPSEVVYMRALESSGADFGAWAASHVVANLLRDDKQTITEAFRPGSRGTEALRLVDERVQLTSRVVLLIVDDAHHLDADAVAYSVNATRHMRWLFIGRPGRTVTGVSHRLAAKVEELKGWSEETIAKVMAENKVACDPGSVHEVQDLTGGAPLLVENIAKLAATHSASLQSYVTDLKQGMHTETTALEHLLQRDVTDHLPALARTVGAAMTFIRTPLPTAVIRDLANQIAVPGAAGSAVSVRALVDWRVLRAMDPGTYTLHDTFRPLAVQWRDGLTPKQRSDAAIVIKQHLEANLTATPWAAYALVDYARTLAELGELDVLADLVSGAEEWFREQGVTADVRLILETALASQGGTPAGRYLVCDSLSFMALERGDRPAAVSSIAEQERLLAEIKVPTPDQLGRLATKKILLCGFSGDLASANAEADATFRWLDRTSEAGRVVRYNVAHVAMIAKRPEVAEVSLKGLLGEYFGELGLTARDIFRASPQELLARLGDRHDADILQHAADCAFLLGRVLQAQKRPLSVEFMWAMKFYDLAGAPTSSLKAAFEVVDQHLWGTVDPQVAVSMLENSILPMIDRFRLFDHALEVKSLYAVALACVGRSKDALLELQRLEPYLGGLAPKDLAVVRRRAEMVQGLVDGALRYSGGHLVDRAGQPKFLAPIEPD